MSKRRVSVAVWVAAGLVAAGTAGGPPPAAGQSVSAKGVYEDGNEVGVKFQVLRERGGELRRVSSSHPFRSGDRFKFEVETNRAAFVYVLNRTLSGDARDLQSKGIDEIIGEDRRDRSGSRQPYTLLYPRPGERPPALPAGRRVQLPREDDRFFRMDDNPGVERLYVLASDRRIDISEFFSLESGRQREGRTPRTDRPGRDGSIDDDVLDQLNARLASWAGNALTEFADEDAHSKGVEVSSYGVGHPERSGNSPTAIEVSLKHLP